MEKKQKSFTDLIDLFKSWKAIKAYVASKDRDLVTKELFIKMFENDFKADLGRLMAQKKDFTLREWKNLSEFFYDEPDLGKVFITKLQAIYEKKMFEYTDSLEKRVEVFFFYLWLFYPMRENGCFPEYEKSMRKLSNDFDQIVKDINNFEHPGFINFHCFCNLFDNFAYNKDGCQDLRFWENAPCEQIKAFTKILYVNDAKQRKRVMYIVKSEWFIEMVKNSDSVEDELIDLLQEIMKIPFEDTKEQSLRKDLLLTWKNEGLFVKFLELDIFIKDIFKSYAEDMIYPDIYLLRLKGEL